MRTVRIVFASAFFVWSAPSMAQTTLPPTSADWIVVGAQPTGSFGTRVASAGDVDGDGYDDVTISDPEYDGVFVDSGRITFHRGSVNGPEASPAWTLEGGAPGARLSYAIPAGDVNGDGFDDVVVGNSFGSSETLYLGSSAGPVPSSWSVPPGSIDTGDLNADGFSDLAVSRDQAVNVFHGSAAGLPLAPSEVLTVASTLPFPVQSGAFEDLNGDGFDDYAFTWQTLPKNSLVNASKLTVYLGSADGLVLKTKDFFKGKSEERTVSVAAAGDVDGDGFGDLALTLYGDSLQEVYWLRGRSTGLSTQTTLIAVASGGNSVQGLGDFSGDGFPDLVVPDLNLQYWSFRIRAGSPAGYSAAPVLTVEPVVGDASVSAAGDVNGDGLGDLIVGEPGYPGDVGRVFVFLGRPTP